jgi:hypothetical protein
VGLSEVECDNNDDWGAMVQTIVFRPMYFQIACASITTIPLFGLGVLGMIYHPHVFFGGMAFILLFLLMALTCRLFSSVDIDESGITKLRFRRRRLHVDWGDIESWFVRQLSYDDGDSFTTRELCLKLRDQTASITITNTEASKPSFDSLILIFRNRLPEREVANA